jgi:uncharacterized protein YjiS (DUF1127 family)
MKHHPSFDPALPALLRDWLQRARSRRDIARLDRRTIEDLGLTVAQLEFEANKPFWRR